MLGVAVVNVHPFANGLDNGNYNWNLAFPWFDRAAEYFVNLVFSHRSYPLLAFLLGVGLTLQASRWETVANARWHIVRRYCALLVIGVVHGVLLWPGEVLSAYALIVLILCLSGIVWTERRLRVAMGCALAICSVLTFTWLLSGLFGVSSTTSARACTPIPYVESSFAQTNWLMMIKVRAGEFLTLGLLAQILVPTVWAQIFIGIWAARREGFWQHLRAPSWHATWMQWLLATFCLGVMLEAYYGPRGGWMAEACPYISQAFFFEVAADLTSLVWPLIALTFWAQCAQRIYFGRIRQRLIAVGRAPVTMFIGQSLCFTVLFSNTLLGLHQHLGRLGTFSLAVMVYLTLAAWLDQCYHQRGRVAPGELLWRYLSGRSNTAK